MVVEENKKFKKMIFLILGVYLIFFFGVSCTMQKETTSPNVPIEKLKWPPEDKTLFTKETLKLELMSAYGDNEGYHPKVVAFDEAWNGYYYWIAFTPYPHADQSKENPHILASNDMIDWEEPDGFHNPLEPRPNGDFRYFYNSDTHLLYNKEKNRLECFWRYVDDVNSIVIIYESHTYDGVSWSEKEIFLFFKRKQVDYLSPVVMIEDGKYEVWYVDRDFTLKYIERGIEESEWTSARKINLYYEDKNLRNWHLDVIKTEEGYEMLVSAFIKGQNHNRMNLYYTKSKDNLYYDQMKVLLTPLKYSWNNKGLYRSALLYYQDHYFLFYSGIGKDGNRGVGITYGKSMDSLIWLTSGNVYDFKKITSKTTCYE